MRTWRRVFCVRFPRRSKQSKGQAPNDGPHHILGLFAWFKINLNVSQSQSSHVWDDLDTVVDVERNKEKSLLSRWSSLGCLALKVKDHSFFESGRAKIDIHRVAFWVKNQTGCFINCSVKRSLWPSQLLWSGKQPSPLNVTVQREVQAKWNLYPNESTPITTRWFWNMSFAWS